MTKNLNALRQRQALVRVLIFSLVTVIIVIIFNIFQSQQKTGLSTELQTLAEPLNPNIDLEVIQRLQQKRAFTSNELASFPINRIVRQSNGDEVVVRGTGGTDNLLANPITAPASPSAETQTSGAGAPSTPLSPAELEQLFPELASNSATQNR